MLHNPHSRKVALLATQGNLLRTPTEVQINRPHLVWSLAAKRIMPPINRSQRFAHNSLS